MTDIQFINLTPHIINLQKFDGTTLELPPSGTVARVEEARATARMIGDMGVSLASYGEVVNLPAPKPWTCYIVSSLVLAAVPERPDVFAPGPAIRNEAGQVIGANGLSCTPSYARLNEVLNRLISPQDMSRKLGLNELATLSEPDINSIFQSFTDQIRQMESSASSQLEKTLFEVVEKKKDLLPQLIAFYEALSDLRIVPAILPMLLRVSKGTPAEGLARNLISRWSKSSNNVLATASKQILNRKN